MKVKVKENNEETENANNALLFLMYFYLGRFEKSKINHRIYRHVDTMEIHKNKQENLLHFAFRAKSYC